MTGVQTCALPIYIKLNEDSKSYIDAMNYLANPRNMDLMVAAMKTAIGEAGEEFKKEHKEAIKKLVGKENEIDAGDVEDMSKKAKGKKEGEKKDLETYLQEEYAKVKTAAEAQGVKAPDYEIWRKTAGEVLAKNYGKIGRAHV